ncbi:MAG: hypothetical protein JO264_14675 [Acidisphaera sp.]|nr:hypothetical protein [Acidisphaera sp.]
MAWAAETRTPPHAAAASRAPAHQAARPEGPKALGRFEDWTAATHIEARQTVCYAFTRAVPPAGPAPDRGDAVLTVTERPGGRDAVAISAGFAYPPNAAVGVDVDQAKLDFYTATRNAFARDGHAAVAAFQKGRQAVAHSPGPRGAAVTDTFSLRGFEAAYAAINKVCPAR